MSAITPESTAGAATAEPSASALVRVYVWELPVRLTHWLIALSLFVLAFTGFTIGSPFISVPGEAKDHFVTGTIKAIHSYAAIVFTLSVLSRIVWMFVGNRYARWHQFLPVRRERRGRGVQTLLFYSFLRRRPPEAVGHNPLAGVTYLVVYGVCLVMIATGLALYSASAAVDSPLRVFDFLVPLFGGLQSARWIHHVGMWLLLGFFAHHLASALLISITERAGTMESIFSGFKFVRREVLERDRREGER